MNNNDSLATLKKIDKSRGLGVFLLILALLTVGIMIIPYAFNGGHAVDLSNQNIITPKSSQYGNVIVDQNKKEISIKVSGDTLNVEDYLNVSGACFIKKDGVIVPNIITTYPISSSDYLIQTSVDGKVYEFTLFLDYEKLLLIKDFAFTVVDHAFKDKNNKVVLSEDYLYYLEADRNEPVDTKRIINSSEIFRASVIVTYDFYDIFGQVFYSTFIDEGANPSTVVKPSTPEVAGYNFIEWDEDDSNPLNIKCTPVFELKEYEVTFLAENDGVIQTIPVQHGFSCVAPAYTAPSGYVFQEWDKDFSNVTSDLEVKVIIKKGSYTISFDSQGGSIVYSITDDYQEPVVKPSESPVKDGYRFIGWFLDVVDTEEYEFTTMPGENLRLYANWVKTWTITFNPNGGEFNDESTIQIKVVDNNELVDGLTSPTREGFTFNGWYVDNLCTSYLQIGRAHV